MTIIRLLYHLCSVFLQIALTIFWLGKSVKHWFLGPQLDFSSFTELLSSQLAKRSLLHVQSSSLQKSSITSSVERDTNWPTSKHLEDFFAPPEMSGEVGRLQSEAKDKVYESQQDESTDPNFLCRQERVDYDIFRFGSKSPTSSSVETLHRLSNEFSPLRASMHGAQKASDPMKFVKTAAVSQKMAESAREVLEVMSYQKETKPQTEVEEEDWHSVSTW